MRQKRYPRQTAVQPPGRVPVWRQRISTLFQRPKLPAWVVIVWQLLLYIPDWKSRVIFWLDAARQAGGVMSIIAQIIGSPYLHLGIIVCAVLWIMFVGEPEKGMQRHSWWPVVGWGLVAVMLLSAATIFVFASGRISARGEIESEVNARLQRYLEPWKMPEPRKEKFLTFLRTREKPFSVRIECLASSSQSQSFALDLSNIFAEDAWRSVRTLSNGLRPDLVGVYLSFPMNVDFTNNAPEEAVFIAKAFDAAGYPVKFLHGTTRAGMPGVDERTFWIVVGNRPPES